MINLEEELVAAYLENIKGCEFIQQNLYTPDVQGEINVSELDIETGETIIETPVFSKEKR